MDVAGIEWSRRGWVAVVLGDGGFARAGLAATFRHAVSGLDGCQCIAVGTPIGLPVAMPREADVEAKRLVGARRASVFLAPPRATLTESTYPAGLARAKALGFGGISQQAFALRHQILEVAPVAASDSRIHEAHPEVSFQAMHGSPLSFGKRCWGGFTQRRELLSEQGIEIPSDVQTAAIAGVDDILDAAAAAWTAHRIATHEARRVPSGEPPNRTHTIWF